MFYLADADAAWIALHSDVCRDCTALGSEMMKWFKITGHSGGNRFLVFRCVLFQPLQNWEDLFKLDEDI